ncbi:MAG: hypothetical protein H8D67_05725 [Deltaproteobacteria bacterium]|nr:hypothetical protein [Deltaproteobacteria bacterium]MBL7176538.1 hypothetical protein [Desulfobacteraceae bacterium]
MGMNKNNLRKFELLCREIEREKFTGKKLIEVNINTGRITRIYEFPIRKEIKE